MRFTRSKLSLAIMVASLVGPTYSYAQEEEGANNQSLEHVVVTGSRIQRSSATTPSPTTVLDSAAIQQLGLVNAGDILNTLPAMAESVGGNYSGPDGRNPDLAGMELPNLRGLGTQRTLVLVNGHRHVGSRAGNSAVDVSSIPSQLIDRVEVITGAASAVYGADAVSGVVNFILKKEFDGISVNAQIGESSEGDGEEQVVSVLAGTTFNDDKGNILFALEFNDRKEVMSSDRQHSSLGLSWFSNNGEYRNPDGTIPQNRLALDTGFLPLNAAGIASSSGLTFVPEIGGLGYVGFGDLPAQTFDHNGNPIEFIQGNCQGIRCENGMGFSTHPYAMLNTPTERTVANTVINYELGSNHSLFADIKYSKTVGEATSQPAFSDGVFGPIFEIARDNPYVPTAIYDKMVEFDIPVVIVNKANADLGKLPNYNEFEVFQVVFGAQGSLNDNLSYEFYAQNGTSKSTISRLDRLNDNFRQAQDAIDDGSGNIVCRDQSNGCAPINAFGPNAASQAAVDFIMRPTITENELEQSVASFSITGDVMELPAGTLQFAAGLEYRKETSESIPEDILLVGGLTNNTHFDPLQIVKGSYDVNEVFGELRIPVVSGVQGIQDLTVETAVRLADYSTVGSTSSYKLGVDWTITDSVRARTSYGIAVRAPNVGELFRPEQATAEFVVDPCDFRRIDSGPNPALRRSNCEAMGMPDNFESLAEGASQRVLLSGNPELDAEESTSTTFGIVYTPEWAENFSFVVDYWEMEIEEAIQAPNTDEILANCVDFDMTGNPFCGLVQRRDDFQILTIQNKIINIAELTASGYDFEANYMLELEGEASLNFNLVGSYYEKRNFVVNPDKPDEVSEQVDIANSPKMKTNLGVTYQNGPWNTHVSFNYLGASRIATEPKEPTSGPEYPENRVPSMLYTNLRTSFDVNETVNLYVGINNLNDTKPPFLPQTVGASPVYDLVGRYYYAGVNLNF